MGCRSIYFPDPNFTEALPDIEIYRENFIECASLAWWLFAAAFLVTGGVAFFTLLWQSRKAALANPVKALKNE